MDQILDQDATAGQRKNMISREVQDDTEKLEAINQKQEERIHNIEAKALQLINLYFVFQGVILSSISSASTVKCYQWWIPFSLSLLAALLNLFTLYGILILYLSYSEELDQNYEDLRLMSMRGVTRAQIKEVDPGSPLRGILQDGKKAVVRQKPDTYKNLKRKIYSYTGYVFLFGFSGVTLYSCHALLCDRKTY